MVLATLVEELLLAAPGRARRVLLALDQSEELLTMAPAPARAQLAACCVPRWPARYRLSARYARSSSTSFSPALSLTDLPARTFPLRPLRPDALASVIEGPARLADITVDPELIARLVRRHWYRYSAAPFGIHSGAASSRRRSWGSAFDGAL